jgi:hypothetical protein
MGVACLPMLGQKTLRYVYRDYAGDPAAWGALMDKEGVWVEPAALEDDTDKVAEWTGWLYEDGLQVFAARGSNIGETLSAAVLAKHGIDPSPYIGD